MEKSTFAKNLKRARELKGWSQGDASAVARITRPSWGAYEESRAFPSAERLSAIAEVLNVEDDLYGFINNADFFDDQGRRRNIRKASKIEKKYHSLKPPIRMAVDALMGLDPGDC